MRLFYAALFLFLVLSLVGRAESPLTPTASFLPQEIVAAESLAQINADPKAFNVLELPEVQRALSHSAPNAKHSMAAELAERRTRYRQQMRDLGKRTGIGGAIYYPFGGQDPQTPFWMSPETTDVFAQTAGPFGSVVDLGVWSQKAGDFLKEGGDFDYLDSINDNARISGEVGFKGLGPLAMARIQNTMHAEIAGLYFFDIDSEGKIRFHRTADLSKDEEQKNGLILFKDPETGALKRYWRMSHFAGQPGNFPKLAQRLRFDTLMIKAAPDELWNPSTRDDAIRFALDPARANHARVLSDSRIYRGFVVPDSPPQPIFKKDALVQAIKLAAKQSYGYSRSFVFVAPGDSLIDAQTPLAQVYAMAASKVPSFPEAGSCQEFGGLAASAGVPAGKP